MRLVKLFSFALLAVFVSLMSTGVTHAAITVGGPYIDTTTQGDWRQTYMEGGSCFYLLPTPPAIPFTEFLLNTTTDPNVCEGGSFVTSGKLSWDLFTADVLNPGKPIYVYYFDPSHPLSETKPVNATHPADQWNPCVNSPQGGFYGATFDNGDVNDDGVNPVRGIFEPLVSTVTVMHEGSFRIAYYFLEANVGCRMQNYKLFINGTEYLSGSIADFDSGKYVYFTIEGLTGLSVIRLEVTNPGIDVCVDQANYGNVHFSGIFIDKCNEVFQGCTPGYWKQSQHFGSWVGYSPVPAETKFCSVFTCPTGFSIRWNQQTVSDPTLLQALDANGGGVNALARHGSAALLNAANPGVNFPRTAAQIKEMVSDALASGIIEGTKNTLAGWNESNYNGMHNCPLGRNPLASAPTASKSK